jgi:hypothetical protein
MQTVGDKSIILFGVVSIDKNTKNLHLSIMGAPYEIIQTYLKSYSLELQLSFLTILILSNIFRVWSTLSNQEMYRKFSENIVIVLIDIMGTFNIISIFYSYLFYFVSTLPSPGYSIWNPWNGGWNPWNVRWIPWNVRWIPWNVRWIPWNVRWIPWNFQVDSIPF